MRLLESNNDYCSDDPCSHALLFLLEIALREKMLGL